MEQYYSFQKKHTSIWRGVAKTILYIAAILAGLMWYWPTLLAVIVTLGWTKKTTAAIALGIFLDIIYGAPTIHTPLPHFLLVPFTLFALLIVSMRRLAQEFFNMRSFRY